MKSTFIALALAYTVFGADPTPSAWSYQGTLGPAYWHRLSKEFEVCAKGTTQSPINLKTSYTAKQPPTYAFKDAKPFHSPKMATRSQLILRPPTVLSLTRV